MASPSPLPQQQTVTGTRKLVTPHLYGYGAQDRSNPAAAGRKQVETQLEVIKETSPSREGINIRRGVQEGLG